MDAESYRRVGDGFSGGRMCLVVMGDLGSREEEEEGSPCCRMDSRVWRRMPESLVEEVLRRLPIAAQLRFRSVCRRWRDTLSCPNFLWDCPPAGPLPATMLTFESRFSLEESEHFPFPGAVNCYRLKPLRCLRFMHPCASDGGLVCLRSSGGGGGGGGGAAANKVPQSLYVLNPMTRAWRMLPKLGGGDLLFPHPLSVALVVDAPSKAYKVVVTALEQPQQREPGREWMLRIYDSCSDSWHLASTSLLPVLKCRRPAHRDGVLYYLDPHGTLVAFRLEDHSFWEVPAARPLKLRGCAHLVAHRGEILLVGVLEGSFTRFWIWRLGLGGLAWEALVLLSEELFDAFFPNCGARDDSWGILPLGDSICLDLWLYDFVGNSKQVEPDGRRVLLAYDLVIKGWYVMPIKFQDRPECKSRSLLLPFEPRLDLIV